MNRALGFVVGLLAICVGLSFDINDEPTAFAQESGSQESFEPFPMPFDDFPEESGSHETPGRVIPSGPKPSGPDHGEAPTSRPPAEPSKTTPSEPTTKTEPSEFPRGVPGFFQVLTLLLVFLGGLFLVGWSLFRLGLFNPFTATLWPKRLELCMELALRMDDFMTACQEENFNKAQMSLEALNHLNGRRSILLSNEINAAVNKFVDLAVSAKVSKADAAFQKDLNRQYEIVIEALRVGTRQEELTLEVLRSLTKAQGPHKKLKEPSGEE